MVASSVVRDTLAYNATMAALFWLLYVGLGLELHSLEQRISYWWVHDTLCAVGLLTAGFCAFYYMGIF